MLSCFRHQQVKNRERWLRHVIFWGIERGNWQWDRRETKLPTRSACREGQWNESSRISKFVTVSCFGDCFFLAMHSRSYCFRCGLPVGPHFFIFCMHVLVALLLFSMIFKFNFEDKLYFLFKFLSAQPHNKSYFKLVCEMALHYFIYIEFCLCESGLLFLLLNCFASSRYHIHLC